MTTPISKNEVEEILNNFVFAGLSIEQMSKLPKWLLENCEQNKAKATLLLERRETELLNEIGEPKLGDFDVTYEQYPGAVEAVKWYKNRISELKASLNQGGE